jgi:hypothetical protein
MPDIRESAYKGRPDPTKVAQRIVYLLIILLFWGFIRTGIKNGWFVSLIEFIES